MVKSLCFLLLFVAAAFVEPSLGKSVETDNLLSALENSYGSQLRKSSSCGGVLEGPAGVIDFHDYEQLTASECVWTIHVPKKDTIQLRIVHDGYNDACKDLCTNITIFSLSESSTLVYNKEIKYGDRTPHNISGGSLIQIAFTIRRPWAGLVQGFSMTFEGIGPDLALPLNSFKLFKENAIGAPGSASYSSQGSSQTNKTFVSLVLHPPIGKQIALTLQSFCFGQNTGTGDCSHPDQVISMSEVGFETKYPNTRFRECNCNGIQPTTIYSQTPLLVSLLDSGSSKFELTWETVNCKYEFC